MKNEVEQIALQNDMSIEFVTWFFNEKKAGCGNVWFMMMAAMWEGWKGRSIEMDKLAAENVALKESRNNLAEFIHEELDADYPLNMNLETHATDRIVAGIKADGVEEFAAKLRIPGDDQFFDALAKGVALAADDFAKQLRDGGK
ncbi:TPA: hypothetical protein L9429_004399 [Klebsiella pneumoniae]|nr:hypothetical protein [Klebsiella pneumoniae]